MAKTANLYTRIEPEIKEQAESVLSALGISASNAITMFYKQIILNNGLPFEVKLPAHPLEITHMTEEQLDMELKKGYEEMKSGNTVEVKQAFEDIRRKNGI